MKQYGKGKYVWFTTIVVTVLIMVFVATQGTALANFVINAWTGFRLTEGLVAHWTFDGKDMTPSVVDVTGGGYNGMIINQSPTTTTIGKIGQGLLFDGTNDYVTVPDPAFFDGGNRITVGGWAKTTSLSAERYIVTKSTCSGGTDQGVFELGGGFTSAGYPEFTLYKGGGKPDYEHIVGTTRIDDGMWHHVAGTYDGAYVRLYIDGVESASVATTSLTFPATQSSNLEIGSCGGGNYLWDGSLDDIRVYTRALSGDEIRRLYLMGASLKTNVSKRDLLTNGLVGYWTMDGRDINLGTSTREVIDVSGRNNHGDWRNHASTTIPGKVGQGIEFDGVDDQVVIPNTSGVTGLSVLTACAWIKPQDLVSNYPQIFSTYNAAQTNGWDFYLYNQGDYPEGVGLGTSFSANGTYVAAEWQVVLMPFNEWSHVCISQNGNSSGAMKLYLNGTQVTSSIVTSGSGTRSSDSGNDAYIGDTVNAAYPYKGIIDDLRVYNRELLPEEVSELYLMGASLRTNVTKRDQISDGLVGYWTFDGRDVDVSQPRAEFRDLSGYGNHANWLDHATTTAPGKIGQGIEFTATPSVDVGYIASTTIISGLSTFTICAWAKPISTAVGFPIIFSTINSGSTSGWDFYFDNYGGGTETMGLGTSFSSGGGSVFKQYGSIVRFNEWNHVCAVQNGNLESGMKLYVNATEYVTTGSGVATRASASSNAAYIAGDVDGDPYDGTLDELRIYNRVLSDSEIMRLYRMGE